jgi:L-threonylcarbamoyladenylate synthase
MRVLRADGGDAERRAALTEAAAILRAGGLVAFPTETVYGLGANALDADAVQRIYDAKGRPAINPLIVHVAGVAAARELTTDWTPLAQRLADAFWPGPLTLVLRKRAIIPGIVTAGGDTVGLRVPANAVALALLNEVQLPIAAPSANPANHVSPTTAQHVIDGLGDAIDLVIDGGPTTVGIESTVVDATDTVPRVLRPGMIDLDALAGVAVRATTVDAVDTGHVPRSPGMLGKHYAPRATLVLVDSNALPAALRSARDAGSRPLGVLTFGSAEADVVECMPRDAAGYARRLYAALHAMDAAGCARVLVERPPDAAAWAAINDRLERAAR